MPCAYWKKQNERKVTIINQSKEIIDSVNIAVFSATTYFIKVNDIKVGDTIVKMIPVKAVKSNKHDITVSITVFQANNPPLYEYSYNDLIGYLAYDYTFVLKNDGKLKWKTSL